MSYIVYMHENKINNKKYIGITNCSMRKRSNNGKGYKGCTKFYNAIEKYGWDNFRHKILYKGLSKEEAELKEKEMIKQYNTQVDGYNINEGGNVSCLSKETKEKISRSHLNNSKRVILTMPNGARKYFNNVEEASREMKVDKTFIRGCCEGTIPTNKINLEYF